MDYPFNVQRGWPAGGAIDSNETVLSGQTVSAGDVVEFDAATGHITPVGAVSATRDVVGWVVRGNGDSDSVVAAGDRAVVVWGSFIARTQKCDDTGLQAGDKVEAAAGILQAVTTGAPVATVTAVHGDGSITILVK